MKECKINRHEYTNSPRCDLLVEKKLKESGFDLTRPYEQIPMAPMDVYVTFRQEEK